MGLLLGAAITLGILGMVLGLVLLLHPTGLPCRSIPVLTVLMRCFPAQIAALAGSRVAEVLPRQWLTERLP